MRKAFALLLFMTPLIGVAPDAADAKKSSTKARVHHLEKRLKVLERIVSAQSREIDVAMEMAAQSSDDAAVVSAALDSVVTCFGAVPSDFFVLPGTATITFVVSEVPVPMFWTATIGAACVDASTAQARVFGPRKFRLVLP